MSYSSENIRRACFELQGVAPNRLTSLSSSNYSNKLRESCRKLVDKYSIKKDCELNQFSNLRRHEKFAMAKLELKRLQEQYKNYCSKKDRNEEDLLENMYILKSNQMSSKRKVNLKTPKTTDEKNVVSILKKEKSSKSKEKGLRVRFNPESLFWDSALEGDLQSLRLMSSNVSNVDHPNFCGVTALHNAANSGSLECVNFLVEIGCNINVTDDCGWTPLHYSAYYGKIEICELLITNGANVFMRTFQDNFTPSSVCGSSHKKENCKQFLLRMEKTVGIQNGGKVYASHDYSKQNPDELSLKKGDQLIILSRGDRLEKNWWWGRNESGQEGYVPYNLLTIYKYRMKKSKLGSNF